MNITIGGKKILHSYHHYIMELEVDQFKKISCEGFRSRTITEADIPILSQGDFALANMTPYLHKQKLFSTGLLFYEEASNQPVGYIWIVRRGGNEMSYRIRKIEGLISCVCVFKPFRGQNIANLMICEIVKIFKDEGHQKVALAVNTDNVSAIRAYEKAGFQKVDDKYFFRILRKNFPYHIL